ncbi:MAG TPA: hypothetical protein VG095_07660, partial [Chthoniobacterales bacterium]|nr:hypothetical protein [Chthoniobacterales bacterium]
ALLRLTDPALRARLGANGYRRVFEHFALERMWQATDELYAQVLRASAVTESPTTSAAPAPVA